MISAVTDLKACERCDIPPGIAELLRPFEKQLAGKRILTAGGRAGATGACGIEAPRNDGGPKYDVVLLTGLLETANAPQLVLAGATAMLERGGAIMIAVENGLGAGNIGASRGGRAGARLGKQQLTHLIRHAGVRHYRFYYPFPDLNAPSVLLSDDAFGDEQLDVVNLIEPVVTGRSEAGTGAHYLIRALTANGLMKELCDHFFIVLSDNAGWFPDEGILAWTFNPGRRETFKKMTTFYRDDDGALRVRRDPCGTDRRRARGVAVLQQLQDEYYLPGRLYSLRLADIVCSPGWSTADVAAWASPYAELLRSELTLIDDGEWLEGRHLDLVPFNLLTDDRRLTAIDAEWVATEPLPLQYVLFRGIYHTLARIGDVAQPAAGTPLNLYGLCLAVAAQLIADTGGMLETFLTLEPRYFGEVFGGIGTAPADADLNVRSGDDGAAKMCVSFDFDVANLPLGEQTRLSIARSRTGEDVPTETLCYVWDNKLPRDTTLVNAFTKRQRFIVIQSGAERLGQWVAERRDVIADYRRVFADESGGKVPDIISVTISADADNTHGHGLAYFGDIAFGL